VLAGRQGERGARRQRARDRPAEGSRPWPSIFVTGAVVLAALIFVLEAHSLVLFVGGLFALPVIRAMGPIAVRERLQIARTPPVAITRRR
jgi:hypothetical protein